MQIQSETLDQLHNLKRRGQSYDDVVQMLLQNYYESNNIDNVK